MDWDARKYSEKDQTLWKIILSEILKSGNEKKRRDNRLNEMLKIGQNKF